MKILSSIAIAAIVSSCGFLDRDSDNSPSDRGTVQPPNFSLTEVTVLDANAIRAKVNNLTFLAKLDIATQSAKDLASTISRGKSPTFKKCVETKLDTVPLAVTTDTVSYEFNFDFIALCDDAATPDDLIDEIKNTMRGRVTIGCAGGKIADLVGKEAKDLDTKACNDSQSFKFSYNFEVNSRKTTKTKNGTETEVTDVDSKIASSTLSAADGGPCIVTVTDKKTRSLASCQLVTQSKTFKGAPKFETNSPVVGKDGLEKDPRPQVYQSIATVKNAVIDTDAPYYSSANTTFQMNGWNGTMTYTSSWARPTWKAERGGEKIAGTFGTTTPGVVADPAATPEAPIANAPVAGAEPAPRR